MKLVRISFLATALCAALILVNLAVTVHGADKPKAAAPPAHVDPKAAEILKMMTDAVKNSKALRLEMKMNLKAKTAGAAQEAPADYSFVLERPNKLAMRNKGDGTGVSMVSDGEKLHVILPTRDRYRVVDAPTNIAGISKASGAAPGPHWILLNGLFSDDPYTTMIADAEKILYMGMSKDGNTELHHLKVVQPTMDWNVFISAEDPPLLTKMMSDMRGPNAGADNASMQVTITYTNWDLAAKTTSDDFKFTPPAGAVKVEGSARERRLRR